MARREYQGGAVVTTLTGGITSGAASLVLTTATGWPTGSFSAVIDKGLSGEEKILCTSRSGTTVTITTRGYDGTTASSHLAGASIAPCLTAIDLDEANAHVVGTLAQHAATTSAQLASIISDETGTGSLVFAASPTMTSPLIDNPALGFTTTVTAAATTTLTVTSNHQQTFTGTTTQIVALPVASTMKALGQGFRIVNNSTGTVTVNSSGGNLVKEIAAGTTVTVIAILLSGTTAASWDAKITGQATLATATSFVGCSVYKAAGQIVGAATFTTLLFDSENYDTSAFHDTGTNTGRLTIPAGKTGYYRVSLMWALTTDLTIIKLLVNGVAVTRGTYSGYMATVNGSGSTPLVFESSIDLYLTAADYVEAQIYSVGGGTTQQQIFSIAYLGA